MFRHFWRALACHPRSWVLLLLWPAFVLLFVLAPLTVCYCSSPHAAGVQTAAIATAVLALGVLLGLGVRFHRGIRAIRTLLFQGEFEAALDAARRNAAAGVGAGFESALARLLDFDRRRAERVAASTRLVDCLLREAPVPFFVGDLEESLIRFNRAMCKLFEITDERFSLFSLLLMPANRPFADLWESVASGERTRAEAVLTLHLPVRRTAERLDLQLSAAQDDEGHVLYILGFARPPKAAPPEPPPEVLKPTRRFRIQNREDSRELPQE